MGLLFLSSAMRGGIVSFFAFILCLGVAYAYNPVYVSTYLPNNYAAGQSACKTSVDWDYPSYSGYITVNSTYNSNTFFWYFPAQSGDASAPTILWLNGGPGFSSLFGMFNEIGPFYVSTDNFPALEALPFTWNKDYNLVFMDNPVGVGFSYTEDSMGYSRYEEQVADNLYSAVSQFFQLFPNLQKNDFYFAGESYAGKYVPSACYKIWQMSQQSGSVKIPLVGISIGDGIMDPQTQTQGIANQAYQFGMFNENERQIGLAYEAAIKQHIVRDNYVQAFKYFDEYLNGDFFPYPTFYENVTGLGSYFNFLDPVYPSNPYDAFLNLESTQNAINVRKTSYIHYNKTVESFLIDDWMRSVASKMPTLLDNYKVMIYNGQNDVILGPPPAESFIRGIPWSGQLEYLATKKIVWKINNTDTEPAGYVRQTGKFLQVIIRDAGHMVPTDQPARAYDMITRFIEGRSFSN